MKLVPVESGPLIGKDFQDFRQHMRRYFFREPRHQRRQKLSALNNHFDWLVIYLLTANHNEYLLVEVLNWHVGEDISGIDGLGQYLNHVAEKQEQLGLITDLFVELLIEHKLISWLDLVDDEVEALDPGRLQQLQVPCLMKPLI